MTQEQDKDQEIELERVKRVTEWMYACPTRDLQDQYGKHGEYLMRIRDRDGLRWILTVRKDTRIEAE